MGGTSVENAAWSYDSPYDELDVKEYLAFRWDAVEIWLADDRQIIDQPRDDVSARANPFVDWVVQKAWRPTSLRDSVQQLADVLVENGLPLWPLRLLIRTLNSQLFGMAYIRCSTPTRRSSCQDGSAEGTSPCDGGNRGIGA